MDHARTVLGNTSHIYSASANTHIHTHSHAAFGSHSTEFVAYQK